MIRKNEFESVPVRVLGPIGSPYSRIPPNGRGHEVISYTGRGEEMVPAWRTRVDSSYALGLALHQAEIDGATQVIVLRDPELPLPADSFPRF